EKEKMGESTRESDENAKKKRKKKAPAAARRKEKERQGDAREEGRRPTTKPSMRQLTRMTHRISRTESPHPGCPRRTLPPKQWFNSAIELLHDLTEFLKVNLA